MVQPFKLVPSLFAESSVWWLNTANASSLACGFGPQHGSATSQAETANGSRGRVTHELAAHKLLAEGSGPARLAVRKPGTTPHSSLQFPDQMHLIEIMRCGGIHRQNSAAPLPQSIGCSTRAFAWCSARYRFSNSTSASRFARTS